MGRAGVAALLLTCPLLQLKTQPVNMPAEAFPEIKSTHSLVAKHVTKEKWDKLADHKTATSGFTLAKAIACAVHFDNQHCGIYAGDWDSYKDFAEVFDPLIQEYHGISADAVHTSDMDVSKIQGNIDSDIPVKSVRIRVGRSIDGFGLSPGITKEQGVGVENLMKNAFPKLPADLAGNYYPLTGMDEKVRQQLVDDHFLFMSGDPNLQVAGMERDWPEGRGIFHNKDKTFLTWVNEEDQLRIISMQSGGDVRAVVDRLGYTKEGLKVLEARCEELHLQPRGTRGESGGQTGVTYDISNKHRLGYSEVELVQKMIDGVNTLHKEDQVLKKKHGL